MLVRTERDSDRGAVFALNAAAFETDAEARLVVRLRADVAPLVSLVADDGGEVVGHILFSPVTLDGANASRAIGLAPMAVVPGRQRSGIGSGLVRAGLEACRELGVTWVVVLGHPEYYPRFGFVPASRFGLTCEYDVPDEVFMAQELVEGSLAECEGCVRYHPAFAEV